MIRFLEIQSPNCRETLHRPLPKATLVCKKKEEEKNPKEKAHLHQSTSVLLCFIDPRVRKNRNEASVALRSSPELFAFSHGFFIGKVKSSLYLPCRFSQLSIEIPGATR